MSDAAVNETTLGGTIPGATTAPLLRVEGIETFYGPIQAIRGVSLEVAPGKIVTVLGANGAGKTTVLRTISGVLDPERGKVVFEGRDISHMPPDQVMRLGVCHVPEGREVFPFLTVRENLMMGAYTRRDPAGVASDLALCFGYFPRLEERQHQRAGLLSGGEQQMLAISRALMGKPKLLLLDEPSLGLSPILVQQIFGIIRRINRGAGRRHPAGRAERPHRAQNRRLRLRAGGRAHRGAGRVRRPAGARGHPRVLSGPEGNRRPRPTAVEEEAPMELSPLEPSVWN